MPIKTQQSLLTSELAKKVISPKRELNLPAATTSESPSIQIETVRHNGYATLNMVQKFCCVVTILSNDVVQLKCDNAALKIGDLKGHS
jgi:hypothetical protein